MRLEGRSLPLKFWLDIKTFRDGGKLMGLSKFEFKSNSKCKREEGRDSMAVLNSNETNK